MSEGNHQEICDYYDQIRHQIEHEDNLVTQRLSWLMASQSFLFTAYAIVLNGLQPAEAGAPLEDSKLNFCHLLPTAGIISTALIYASILGGLLAIKRLRKLWLSMGTEAVSVNRPPIQSCGIPTILGQSAPWFLPLFLIGIWFYLLFEKRMGV